MSHINFLVDKKIRLDKAILEHSQGLTRGQVQKIIEAGLVEINDKLETDSGRFVLPGNSISATLELPKPTKQDTVNLDIKILFHDHGLIVIDKPAGISVHPGSGTKEITLAEKLLELFPQLENIGEKHRAGIVHRLDKETSGCMLIAETQDMYEHLRKAFESRQVKKEYIALISGFLENNHQTIKTPIGASKQDFRKQTTTDPKDPKASETELFAEKWLYFPRNSNKHEARQKVDEYTLIKVLLHTGRTHQIRVHCASINHPVAGDMLYGPKKVLLPGLKRQFLHASSIQVELPSNVAVYAESQLPEDLVSTLARLEEYKF